MKAYLKVPIEIDDAGHCSSGCQYNQINAHCSFIGLPLAEDSDYRPLRRQECIDYSDVKPKPIKKKKPKPAPVEEKKEEPKPKEDKKPEEKVEDKKPEEKKPVDVDKPGEQTQGDKSKAQI